MASVDERIQIFRRLHESGCFVMPNPWDIGSARLLAGMGFRALATTSAGMAWSLGHADTQVPLGEVLNHLRAMSAAVDLPFNADFEKGFAVDPSGVEKNVSAAALTGIAGLSIEDSTGDAAKPIFEFELAVDRIRAARRAIDASGRAIVLTGRSEGFLVGRTELAETIRRLTAYAEAGADCLYAPGFPTRSTIATVVSAVAPRPVNVLIGAEGASVADLTAMGVRRVSVGGALARAAWGGFLEAAREIAAQRTFTALARGTPGAELNRAFAQ